MKISAVCIPIPLTFIRPFVRVMDPYCIYSKQILSVYDCEHIVPRSFIKNKCVERDLHNIFKCDLHINRQRGNKSFVKDFLRHNNEAKGIVARTCLYYLDTYRPDEDQFYKRVIQKDLLYEWFDEHGKNVTEFEYHRNEELYRQFGSYNKYIASFVKYIKM